MIDPLGTDDTTDREEQGEGLRSGPLWRHALYALGVTLCGLALGWVASVFRLGPPEYGIPSAAPGSPWALLAACGAAGLVVAGLLRGAAARIPVHAPGRAGFLLVFMGTRLALGFRPEPDPLAAGAAVALLAAVAWIGQAAWFHHRAGRAGGRPDPA
ncbi:hypothetical protein ACFWUZ_27900 [Streptomyces sp. NPDC058646]|uniref:hypothetical protein n=1 Tax=Streptomyces sp. NPDC058646 TaxID=3346574 RepID=UPI00365BB528